MQPVWPAGLRGAYRVEASPGLALRSRNFHVIFTFAVVFLQQISAIVPATRPAAFMVRLWRCSGFGPWLRVALTGFSWATLRQSPGVRRKVRTAAAQNGVLPIAAQICATRKTEMTKRTTKITTALSLALIVFAGVNCFGATIAVQFNGAGSTGMFNLAALAADRPPAAGPTSGPRKTGPRELTAADSRHPSANRKHLDCVGHQQ